MQNRSPLDLPVLATPKADSKIIESELSVYEITYLHFHEEMEIGICLSGRGVCRVEDEEYPFSVGDVQIIFPYQRHLHRNDTEEQSRWRWLHIRPEEMLTIPSATELSTLNVRLSRGAAAYGILNKELFPKTCRTMKELLTSEEEHAEPFAREHLLIDAYRMLLFFLEESAPLPKRSLMGDDRMTELAPALQKIQLDLATGTSSTVSELSALCGISVSGFRRIFSAALGASPKDYITACRIRRAKHRLQATKESVLSIALSVGYQDVSGFNRAFLQATGETPNDYRQRRARR